MNTKIEYLYRSGANYKWHGEVILPGAPVMGMARFDAAMRGTCEFDDRFIASQVGLPEVFPWVNGEANYDDEEDHCFHEFAMAVTTEDAPTMNMSPEAMLEQFRSAQKTGWEVFDPVERNLGLFS